MVEEQYSDYNYFSDINTKVRDLEERQKLTKDRVLLIGQNLVEIREKTNEEINGIIKDVEMLKADISRIKKILTGVSEEISNMARKEDFAMLSRQLKMFDPLKKRNS